MRGGKGRQRREIRVSKEGEGGEMRGEKEGKEKERWMRGGKWERG